MNRAKSVSPMEEAHPCHIRSRWFAKARSASTSATEGRSDAMHILEHLFLVGEFPARAHLLSGLTLEQVTLCPDGASHSIYEELWHVVSYQQSVIEPGD